MNLVIVETPAQAKRVADIFGEGWQIEPCYGNVRDLPVDQLGVDVRHDFRPTYTLLPRKGNLVRRLMRALSKADAVYVATPPTLAGEAMAWHVLALSPDAKDKPIYRVSLTALTPEAIHTAFDVPRSLNMPWIEAEMARRIADRLVGYLVAPLASQTLGTTPLVSRFGAIGLRVLVEREREIASFIPETRWQVTVQFTVNGEKFELPILNASGLPVALRSQKQAAQLATVLNNATFWVDQTGQSVKICHSPPTWTTGDLLHAAAQQLGLPPVRTLALAESLYEAGWITYPQTNSTTVTLSAIEVARTHIRREYGTNYLADVEVSSAEHAVNECIRPTDVNRLPEALPGDGAALYGLIWRRFISSQMFPAQYRVTVARILVGQNREKPFPLELRAQGRQLYFDGWLRFNSDAEERCAEVHLPTLTEGTLFDAVEVRINERTAEVPQRFSEAGLVGALGELGIGQPAFVAHSLHLLLDKGSIREANGQLFPSDSGSALYAFLNETFPDLVSIERAVQMDSDFKRIAEGETTRLDVLRTFWESFQPGLAKAIPLAPAGGEHKPILLRPATES